MSRPLSRRVLLNRGTGDLSGNAWQIWRTLVLTAPSTGAAFLVPWETLIKATACRLPTVRRHLRSLAGRGLLTLSPHKQGPLRCTLANGQPLARLPGEGRELEQPPGGAWRWTWHRSIDPELDDYWGSAHGPLRWRRSSVVVKRDTDGLWLGGVADLLGGPLGGEWAAKARTRNQVANMVTEPVRIPEHWPDNDSGGEAGG